MHDNQSARVSAIGLSPPPRTVIGRRAFIEGGTLVMAAAATAGAAKLSGFRSSPLRAGLVTDLHFADKPPAGNRHYRETIAKLTEAAEKFRGAELAFVVELGDFIDAADSVDVERRYLERINSVFTTISDNRHYVLGNHCVHTLTKPEFLDGIERPRSYYSFDAGGIHFVVLDACFRGDGEPYGRKNFEWTDPNIPPGEVDWLREDLKAATGKTIVCVHQRLDVSDHYGVRNGAEVRQVLENSGKVLAVLQGHSHRNDYRSIRGIHYCTLVAMVEGAGAENNGYAILEIDADAAIRITGFRRQDHYAWRT